MFRMFRSLRWRLQAWHALILLAVILVFGSMLHWEMIRAHWDRVDDELLGTARILEGSMNAVPASILEAMAKDVTLRTGPRRPQALPNRPRRDPFEPSPSAGPPQLTRPRDRPMRDWKFPLKQSDANSDWTQEEWEASVELPPELPEALGWREGGAYFVIWRGDGSILKESKMPTSGPSPTTEIQSALDRDRYARQQRGAYREVFIQGPKQTIICVGRSAMLERIKTERMTWTLVLSGVSVFCVGLIGGWWFSHRAIEPIARMSKTAERISAQSLSDRIDLKGCDSELEGLGASLNTMFDRLAQSFEQQRQFTADASHEFRTPLAIMLASCELALSKTRSPEEYREQLEKCQRAALRMRELSDSLLVLARLDANPQLEFQALDLSVLLKDAVDFVRPIAEQKQIQIEVELARCPMDANHSMLRQAIDNLLSNAIKYNKQGGFIKVRSYATDQSIQLEVEDNGIGIPASELPKLFDRFYRVDESRSRGAGGIGLGLSIVKKILNCHRGEISIRSTEGLGTTVQVVFPKQVA